MRRITLGTTGIETSALGFGCASLGSRVAAGPSLRALEAAHHGGVTWLDLAPAYGRGAAETIAADFLAGRRDRVQVATKVGLVPPAAGGGLAAALLPLARRAVEAVPGLRARLRRSAVQANAKLPITGELVTRTLETSLRRLRIDHVDLYALHNAAPEEVARDDVCRALEDLRAAGKIRAAAVAGDAAAARAALRLGPPYGVIQIALPPPGADAGLLAAAQAAGFGVIVHSVLGVGGALARLLADPAARSAAQAATGLADPGAALARLLLVRAATLNPEGVALVSMVSEASRAQNLAPAAIRPDPAAAALLARLLAPAESP